MHAHRSAATSASRPPATRRLLFGIVGAVVAAVLVPSALVAARQRGDIHEPRGALSAWSPCVDYPTVQCAQLTVPVDWAKPRGETISLGVVRHVAEDQQHRIGTLFYNPGGPGASPAEYILNAELLFSQTLLDRFDMVGLDPRGTGSTAVHCDVPVVTATSTLFPRSEAEFDALRRHNRDVGRSCFAQNGRLLAHTDTVSVARDHEALRRALGERQISWFGVSYGTQLAANYAELFPRHTRAMVLDGALEHNQTEVHQVADEILAVEDSFDRFAEWCATDPTCELQGQDVAAVFDELVRDADANPIVVPGAVRAVTGEDIRLGTIGFLTIKEPSVFGPDRSWAGLSRALAAALDGDGTWFAIPADDPQDDQHGVLAIGCMEYVPMVDTYAEMQQRIEMGRQLAPHLQGASETWQVNNCIDWPLPVANPPRSLDVHGVDTLIVHSTHDPSVPYTWAYTLAGQIDGAAILTREGDGHTSYNTSPCARAAIDAYLLDPVAPATSTCTD